MSEHLSAHLNQPDDMSGGLWVIGVHVLHLMVDLFGPPRAVRATVEKYGAWSTARSREDVASLTMLYDDKLATFDFTVHENCEWFESSEVTVYAEKGQLTFGVLPGRIDTLLLDPKDGPAGWHRWHEGSFVTPWSGPKSLYSELPQVGNRYFFDREVDEFIAAARGEITGGGATAGTAYEVAAVVAAALESAAAGGASAPVATL
jgi:predicted dehydrogenase